MSKVRASIYGGDPHALHALLNDFLQGGLSFVSRLGGCQMFYQSQKLELSVETMEDVNPTFNVDATLRISTLEAIDWTQALARQLDAAGALFLLSCVEVDASGDELGEEKNWESTGFDDRYDDFRAQIS